MKLSTLLLTTLLGTSIAVPTNPRNAALITRDQVGSLDNLAARATDVFKREGTSQVEKSDHQQQAINAVQAGLITSLLPYLYTGGSGILGNLVDALISLLRGLGLKKRHHHHSKASPASKNPPSNTGAGEGHTQKKRDQTVQLTHAEVAEVALETLETIKAYHEAGASWHDAVTKPFPKLGKGALKAGQAFDLSKLSFEA